MTVGFLFSFKLQMCLPVTLVLTILAAGGIAYLIMRGRAPRAAEAITDRAFSLTHAVLFLLYPGLRSPPELWPCDATQPPASPLLHLPSRPPAISHRHRHRIRPLVAAQASAVRSSPSSTARRWRACRI